MKNDKIYLLSNEKFYQDFSIWANHQDVAVDVVSDGSTNTDNMLGAIGDLDYFLNKTKLEEDLYVFDHYDAALEAIGKAVGIDFSSKFRRTKDIRNLLAQVKKTDER